MTGSQAPSQPLHLDTTYFPTVLGNGEICPISELIGRRRIRSIAAGSAEGRKLLRSGAVTIQVLDGRRFSGMPVVEIYDRLVHEVREAAVDPALDPRAREDLHRLDQTLRTRRATYS